MCFLSEVELVQNLLYKTWFSFAVLVSWVFCRQCYPGVFQSWGCRFLHFEGPGKGQPLRVRGGGVVKGQPRLCPVCVVGGGEGLLACS